jgi:hypothetical protein
MNVRKEKPIVAIPSPQPIFLEMKNADDNREQLQNVL